MNKAKLTALAGKLVQPSPEAAEEYAAKHAELILTMNQRMEARDDILDIIGGEDNLDMMRDNHVNHANFMTSLFRNYNAATYANIVVWVYNTYMEHGFTFDYWKAQLPTWLELYKESFSDKTYNEIEPFYLWILTNHEAIIELATTKEAI